MSEYIKLSDLTYPVGESFIRSSNADKSLPAILSESDIDALGYATVLDTPRPTAKRYEMVRELAPQKNANGDYAKQYEVVPLPFDPIKDEAGTILKTTEEVKAEYLAQWKTELNDHVAQKRFAVETGGVTLPDGTTIKTDRESQAQLSSAYTSLKNGLIPSTQWKADGTWLTVTLAEIEPIAQAVAVHVANSFNKEKAHQEAIDAITTFAEAESYDGSINW